MILPVQHQGTGGSEGLVRANERFAAILNGKISMPFGKNGQHVPVKIIDFDDPSKNTFATTTEFTYNAGQEKRMDNVLFINGIPLIIGECKTPMRPSESWVDAAIDIEDYQKAVPGLFVPNLLCFATEGKELYYGSVKAPLDVWGPWKDKDEEDAGARVPAKLANILDRVKEMLSPQVMLDFLENFVLFATNKKNQKIKIIPRHQQYHTTNKIVQRVIDGMPKKGLIWHFQGSGKSLLMAFASQKLRMSPELNNPTVLIVVDRIDLDTQITGTFNATDIPNIVAVDDTEELRQILAQDIRKIVITTIHKFKDMKKVLNARDNIIVMVDEAHRTQEGDLGRKMRAALPNALFFGLTGTPINRRDHNTFWTFGAEEDENRYMSRYSFRDSIQDRATLPLHFEPRLLHYHIDRETIDEELADLTDQLDDDERSELIKRAGRKSNFIHGKQRVKDIVKNIHEHFIKYVEPNGFKAMIICYDREACVQYKQALDTIMDEGSSDIVMTLSKNSKQKDPEWWYKRWDRTKQEEEDLLDRFRDSADPLKLLIVTAKLLTGFDAPILQTIYLDKLLKDHTLLQAVCRANRPYGDLKSFGLIVDYIGVFDEVGKSLMFDEKEMQEVVKGIILLKEELPKAVAKCLEYFPGVDRTLTGYEGLIAAQECNPTNEVRDAFAADYSVLNRLWEALSPDECLDPYVEDYSWLTQVYLSLKPPSGTGKLLWHMLGAKTLDIINRNVRVDTIQDDLDTVVLDAETVRTIVDGNDPTQVKIIEIKIIKRLQKHANNPIFISLGQKLEDLKQEYEDRFISSLEFLRRLLSLAREIVEAERQVEPEEEQKKAKAALTELFNEAKTKNTHIIVERIVNDIDSIVKAVRWEGGQESHPGEREVKQALRSTLRKYHLHQDQDLFDRAYAYIKQYY